jgi:hypothetical protein
MNLPEAISQQTPPTTERCELIYLNGAITADTEEKAFRIYPDPLDARSYYLVKKVDVVGEIYEWNKEELASHGVVGAKVFRVALRYGTDVMVVSYSLQKLGVTIGGEKGPSLLSSETGCQSDSSCSYNCCYKAYPNSYCRCSTCCVA